MTIEAPAPTKRAIPSGPGESPSARVRSVRRTAKTPQKSPKKPKAPSPTARSPRGTTLASLPDLVAVFLPALYANLHVGDVRVAYLLEALGHQGSPSAEGAVGVALTAAPSARKTHMLFTVLALCYRASCCRYLWTKAIAMLPSPTAEATRLTGLNLTSPQANTPGRLDSRR